VPVEPPLVALDFGRRVDARHHEQDGRRSGGTGDGSADERPAAGAQSVGAAGLSPETTTRCSTGSGAGLLSAATPK
jgi:hypothetical protein